MSYTLGQAAKATGKAKGTILNALAKGWISGHKDALGNWSIDPAELHRVYPVASVQQNHELNAVTLSLHGEIKALEDRLKAIAEERDRLSGVVSTLTIDRDAWREQAQGVKLLAAPQSSDFKAVLDKVEALERSIASLSPLGHAAKGATEALQAVQDTAKGVTAQETTDAATKPRKRFWLFG